MPESQLSQLQHLFAKAILSDTADDIALEVVPGGKLNARQAVDVYRQGYVARLTEALGETFEGVWFVLGDNTFFRLCREYIRGHPSLSHNLSDYGEEFPSFLSRQEGIRVLPFLEELARFEWTFKDLFHQQEHDRVTDAEWIGASLTSDARFLFGGAVRLLTHRYSVYDIWKLRKRKSGIQQKDKVVWDRPEHLILYKREGEIYAHPLQGWEFHVLGSLRDGKNIIQALDCAAPDSDPAQVSRVFQLIRESGAVEKIILSRSDSDL